MTSFQPTAQIVTAAVQDSGVFEIFGFKGRDAGGVNRQFEDAAVVVGGEEGQLFNLLYRADVDRQHLVISAMTLIRPVAGDIQPPSLYNRSF